MPVEQWYFITESLILPIVLYIYILISLEYVNRNGCRSYKREPIFQHFLNSLVLKFVSKCYVNNLKKCDIYILYEDKRTVIAVDYHVRNYPECTTHHERKYVSLCDYFEY